MHCELISHMGTDLTVVNAARVSFDKHKDQLDQSDTKLIQYLAKNGHWTPFGHPQITLRETIPIFVARQRIRHFIGFVYNEVSRRYVDSDPEFYETDLWRKKAENKKQGSSLDGVEKQFTCDALYRKAIRQCEGSYKSLLELGVCPEQARIVLPLSTHTSWYVTGSLAAWARAYKLRSHPHAQQEIQDLAKMWNDLIEPLFPESWKALTEQA